MDKLNVCLISDFDGVIMDSLPLIDGHVKKLDYKASDEYCKKLVDQSNYCHMEKQRLEEEQKFNSKEYLAIIAEIEELRRKRKEHYDHKNIVLEEVYPETRNKIPYDEIYQLENAFDGAIETLTRIWERYIYHRFIVCSNVNTGSEILSKRVFIKKYLPMAIFIPLQFFIDPYFDPESGLKNRNRIPTDKLDVLVKRDSTIDIHNSDAIDDTKGVIESGIRLGFNCYHRGINDNVNEIFITAANNTIDRVHDGKIKKLSL